jgi:glycosyltransferase involved in cell wall biosynthesis
MTHEILRVSDFGPHDAADRLPLGIGRAVATEPMTTARVLLDCRWLGMGGAGRVTELLLKDLQGHPPQGHWLLWGEPDRLRPLVFAGATIEDWHGRPERWFGQGDWFRLPRADVAIFLHQIRPLGPGPSITFIHDTIPARLERRRLVGLAKRLYFRTVARMSTAVITVSDWSRASIIRDLGVAGRRIHVAAIGVDRDRTERIRELRARSPRRPRVIYVGRFAEHKNLRRLCRAFHATEFHASGGLLVLLGGSAEEVVALVDWIREQDFSGIVAKGQCPDDELEQLLASSMVLVQPSIEEGYGLPAVEAAAAGIQVVATRTGYAPEIPPEFVTFVEPFDEASISSGIDVAAGRADPRMRWFPPTTLREVTVAVAERVLAQTAGPRRSPDTTGTP